MTLVAVCVLYPTISFSKMIEISEISFQSQWIFFSIDQDVTFTIETRKIRVHIKAKGNVHVAFSVNKFPEYERKKQF